MSFKKQVLVLKDVFEQGVTNRKQMSGIARIEVDGGIAELYLSLINLPAFNGGEFFVLVIDKHGASFNFQLGARPTSTVKVFDRLPDINGGVSVGVYVVKNSLPITLAFSRTDENATSLCDFKKIVAEKQLEIVKNKRKDLSPPILTSPEDFCLECAPSSYDDEAVATENYFEYDQKINEKLNRVKDFETNVPLKNESFNTASAEETAKNDESANCAQNETDFSSCQDKEHAHYSRQVEKELNHVFDNFPEEERLKGIFPESRWAKVHYSKDKYYVVGLIKENGKEKYICYGVPAVYSPTPPEQLKGFCSFVPASIFNMTGEGFWMLFQDAHTGKCVIHS